MTQDEIAVMDGGKCILQVRGARPLSLIIIEHIMGFD